MRSFVWEPAGAEARRLGAHSCMQLQRAVRRDARHDIRSQYHVGDPTSAVASLVCRYRIRLARPCDSQLAIRERLQTQVLGAIGLNALPFARNKAGQQHSRICH